MSEMDNPGRNKNVARVYRSGRKGTGRPGEQD
jgi:hypothetical protein